MASKPISGSASTRSSPAATMKCVGSCAHQLLHPAWPEHFGPVTIVQTLPLLILLVAVNVYILFKFRPCRTAYSAAVAGTAEVWASWQWRHGPCCKRTRKARNEAKNDAGTKAMNAETKATPEIRAPRNATLEQYGDPLVMNTYLKVTILCRHGLFRAGGAHIQEPERRSPTCTP